MHVHFVLMLLIIKKKKLWSVICNWEAGKKKTKPRLNSSRAKVIPFVKILVKGFWYESMKWWNRWNMHSVHVLVSCVQSDSFFIVKLVSFSAEYAQQRDHAWPTATQTTSELLHTAPQCWGYNTLYLEKWCKSCCKLVPVSVTPHCRSPPLVLMLAQEYFHVRSPPKRF